jgi:hypothetical protein
MKNVNSSTRAHVPLVVNFLAHCVALWLAIETYTVAVPHYINFIKEAPVNLPTITLWLVTITRIFVSYWVVIALGILLADGAVCWLLFRRHSSPLLWQWSTLVLFTFMIIFACTGIVFTLPVPIGQP